MSDSGHHTINELSRINLETLPEDGGSEFNRLIFEKSPYLLQHADNPIDWRAWNDPALELARKQDRPIFLSIGYSTCHWCHVMAGESFTDFEVAALINQHFVPIKVDREERPDIDSTYMQACQTMTGSGGWPLTLILTPDLLPFFAATYIPRDNRQGMPGLISLLKRIIDLWREERAKIVASGTQIHELLKNSEDVHDVASRLDSEVLHLAVNAYRNQYDAIFAGFGAAPKFPAPHNLSLLLRLAYRFDDPAIADMAYSTLRAIRLGGIYDQLGGGVHRYSVDERWLVPHFEKMLYDQALLILASIDAWQLSSDGFYRKMACDIAAYVEHRLTAPNGGFLCGEDADSEGAEGTCYLWSTDEIRANFAEPDAANILRMFGMRENGNFEGMNILHLPEGLEETQLQSCRKTLLPLRERRIQPHLDDKIITAWNGLTIAAFSRLTAATGRPEYGEIAARGATFIRQHLYVNGRLFRRWRLGEAAIPAFLEDYAFLLWGLIELYQSRFVTADLEWSVELADKMIELFSDGKGGLFDTGHDVEKVLVRGRNRQDGAIPSGNGTAALALLRLGLLTGHEHYRRIGEKLLNGNAPLMQRYPTAFAMSLIAADVHFGPAASLVLVTDDETPTGLTSVVNGAFHPRLTTILKKPTDPGLELIAPLVAGKTTINGQAVAWLCRGQSCQAPITEPGSLHPALKGV